MKQNKIIIFIVFPFEFFIYSILFLFKRISIHFKKLYLSEQLYFVLCYLMILFGILPWGTYSVEIIQNDFLHSNITNNNLFLIIISSLISLIPCYITILSPKEHPNFSYKTNGIIFLSRSISLIFLSQIYYQVYQNPLLLSHSSLMQFTAYFYLFAILLFLITCLSCWSLILFFINYKKENTFENIY